MEQTPENEFENYVASLDTDRPIWDHFFMVHNLVVIGTRQPEGEFDLAPKHMAIPMGWQNYFGFVCTPRHRTYLNIKQEKVFTVSYPRPTQVVLTSLTAAPRCEDDTKPSLQALPTVRAPNVECVFMKDAYLYLECELNRIIDGFGENSLIIGKIVGAYVAKDALRSSERDDNDLIYNTPLLAYLSPRRFATIKDSKAFPFPAQFKK
ncbi:MAG: flavin reductase [Candidatus Krumholzibacteria bacterium]|jgi:flavin reductase (DIM6/NTAB) family NADH-FMN oxidoreductase RutF|nr:flavin reductase [Candidatus Krumholzibacteria bacterium]MCK5408023.1 flavin reductase [Candidatus Krumholzibacteria bacterium]